MVRARQCLNAEACFDDLVLADVVDGEFILLFDLDQGLAQLRIVECFGGFSNQCGGCVLNLLFTRLVGAEQISCTLFMPIGIDRLD